MDFVAVVSPPTATKPSPCSSKIKITIPQNQVDNKSIGCCHQNSPKVNSLFLYLFSFLTISMSSGIVYGFPHLRNNLLLNGSTLSESKLGIVYTVGSWSVHGGRFFSGLARDKYGTRIVTLCCLICASLGCLGLAFANESDTVTLSLSFFLVGLGSGGQLCLQPVASLFPTKWQGTLLASLSGAFQISGLVFLVLVQITTNRKWSYGYFAAILFVFALVSACVLPRQHFVNTQHLHNHNQQEVEVGQLLENNDVTDATNHDCHNNNHNNYHVNDAEKSVTTHTTNNNHEKNNYNPEVAVAVAVAVAGAGTTSFKLIKTKEYTLLLLWFSLLLIPMQYYIGTIAFQLEQKGDIHGRYIDLFSICYALAAFVAPIMGKIADLAGVGVSQLIATVLISFSLIILSFPTSSFESENRNVSSGSNSTTNDDGENIGTGTGIGFEGTVWSIQIIGLVFYGIGRMTVFGMYFTNVGKRFGYTHYGTLVGLGLLVSAIFSLFQYALIYIADHQQGNEVYINLICGIIVLSLGVPYCIWLSLRERRERIFERERTREDEVIN
jgi:LAT3 family solute carrier family 43 protein 3